MIRDYVTGKLIAWGKATERGGMNNTSEYAALLHGLDFALREGIDGRSLTVFSNSQLIVRQVNGRNKMRDSLLLMGRNKVRGLLKGLGVKKIHHLPQEYNREADYLSKLAKKDEEGSVVEQMMREDTQEEMGGVLDKSYNLPEYFKSIDKAHKEGSFYAVTRSRAHDSESAEV